MALFHGDQRRHSSLSPADPSPLISPSTESLIAPSETPTFYVSAKESPSSLDDDSFTSLSHSSSLVDVTDEFVYFSHLDDLPSIPPPSSPPPSPPASLSSSESATFQLSSPFPRPQITRPLPSHAGNRRNFSVGNKENPLGPAAGSTASTSTRHIRIQSKPSTVGFPFASSILATSNSLADVRGGSRVPRPSGKGKEVLRASWEEEDSRRSSSDVDLDLSFDIASMESSGSHEQSSGAEAASKVRGHLQRPEWVEIPISVGLNSLASCSTRTIDVDRTPMMVSSAAHNVPASELVRSQSGQLLGTRKRIRSALELREAYLAGETPAIPESSSFAIIMDAEVESSAWEGAEAARAMEALTPGRARAEWVRKTSTNPGLRLGSAMSKAVPSYSPTLAAGFAFNPTDPLKVPLPPSPASRQSSRDTPRPSWSSDARSLRWRRGEPTTPSDTSPTFASQCADSISTTTTPPNDSPIVPDYPPLATPHQPRRKLSKPALLVGLDVTPRREREKTSLSPPAADDADARVGPPRVDGDSDADLAARHRRMLLEGTRRVSAATIAVPHATLAPTRFGFTPAPLTLVREQLNRVAGYEVVAIVARPRPRMSIASFTDLASYPGSLVDEVAPARLYFVLGFLFGPWCWIIGGWWLRPADGEHNGTRGVRCREGGCACGRFIQVERHGGGLPMRHWWWGVDEWVGVNRTASVLSGFVVAGVFIAALRAATV